MKKTIYGLLIVISCFLLVGCGMKKTAKQATEDFLNQYKTLSANVIKDLEDVIAKENMEKEHEDKYREVMKKQYRDLKYEILDETNDGKTATVKVKIKVYDLFKVQNEAAIYLNNHMDEFKDKEGLYDNKKYLNYKLDQMKKTTDNVEYTLNIHLNKDDKGKWKVKELSQ